jgi:hypothetical protein
MIDFIDFNVWSDGCCTIHFDVIIESAYTTNRRELQHVLARGLLDGYQTSRELAHDLTALILLQHMHS